MKYFILLGLLIHSAHAEVTQNAPSFTELSALDEQSRDINPSDLANDLNFGHTWACVYRSRFMPLDSTEILSYETQKSFAIKNGRLQGTDPESLDAFYDFNTHGQLERGKGRLDELYPKDVRTPRMARMMLGHLVYPHKEVVRRLPQALLIRLHYIDGRPGDWTQSYLYCTLGPATS